jgi:hypothetical protein
MRVPYYIATDQRMGRAEKVLEYSARKNSPGDDIDITWMRAGDEGWGICDGREHGDCGCWNIGRKDSIGPYSGRGWATQFTCFRWAIPELCGFQGRAIYSDVDMVALRPLSELLSLDMGGKRCLSVGHKLCVLLFDCEKFDVDWWPRLPQMKRSGWNIAEYRGLLKKHEGFGKLPPQWNNMGQLAADTGIYHYTDMRTQPWKPYPDHFSYAQRHICPDAVKLWHRLEGEASAGAA